MQQIITAGIDLDQKTPQDFRDDLVHGPGAWLSPVCRELRKMLAFRCSEIGALYGDDGELHDSTMPFPIDYTRDSVNHIRHQLEQRALCKMAEPDTRAAGGLCSNERCFRFAGHKEACSDLDGRPL